MDLVGSECSRLSGKGFEEQLLILCVSLRLVKGGEKAKGGCGSLFIVLAVVVCVYECSWGGEL